MKKKSKITAEDIESSLENWCKALSTQFAEDKVPKGWMTAKALAEMLQKSPTRISEMLGKAIRQGKCERKNFRIENGGTVRPVPHYKLKK